MSSYIYKNSKDIPTENLVGFVRDNFNPAYTSETYNWQYLSHDVSNLNAIVNEHDKLISTQGFIFHELKDNFGNVNSAKSETSFLDPNYRGKGLFEKIYDFGLDICSNRKVKYIWGFTALGKLWREKLKFNVFEDIMFELKLIININYAFSVFSTKNVSYQKKLLQFIFNVYKYIFVSYKIWLESIRSKTRLNLTEWELDYDELNSLSEKIFSNENKNYVRLSYSESFVKWRIIENPFINYKSVKITDNSNNLVAIVIYTIKHNTVFISELLYSDPLILKSVLLKFIYFLKGKRINSVYFFGNIKNEAYSLVFSAFKSFGASIYPNENMKFVFKDLGNESTESSDIDISLYALNGLWTEGTKF